jgi:DNA-binding LytR/AlgR family response regulator
MRPGSYRSNSRVSLRIWCSWTFKCLKTPQDLKTADEIPAVIFLTSYDKYTLEAFSVHALD